MKKLLQTLFAVLAVCVPALGNESALKEKIETLILNEGKVSELARMVGVASGIPIIATPEAADKVISCYFKDVPLEICLDSICRANSLWLNISGDGVIIISTLEQELSSREFYTDDYVEIVSIKYPSVFDVGDTLKGLFRDRVVWERPDDDADDPYRRLKQSMDRMDLLSERSQFGIAESNSGTSSSSSSRSSSSRQNDSQYDGDETEKQIRQLQESQAALDGELISQGLNKSIKGNVKGEIRSSLVYLSVLPETNTILIRSSDRVAVKRIVEAIKEIDKPRGQVLLKVSVLSVDLSDGMNTGINWSFARGDASGGFTNNPITAFSDAAASATSPAGPVATLLTKNINLQIEALKKENKVHELSNPTLFVADNEASTVFVGKSSKFLDQVEPGTTVVSDGVVSTSEPSPTLIDRQIGVSLIITPRVHADRTVTLRVLQERSNISDTPRVINYGVKDGADLNISVSDINEESVISTLVAKDSEAVILGGMIRESSGTVRTGIPLLMDIPFIGGLFSWDSRSKARSELLVIIEPYVIAVPGEAGEVSEKLLQKLKVDLNSPLKKEIHVDESSVIEAAAEKIRNSDE